MDIINNDPWKQYSVWNEVLFRLHIHKYKVRRSGVIVFLCPLHNELTPSCKIYPTSNRFICYGCGESGDLKEFVEKVLCEIDEDPQDAYALIDSAYISLHEREPSQMWLFPEFREELLSPLK